MVACQTYSLRGCTFGIPCLEVVDVGREVVSDGFYGHSQGDLEGSTYVAGMKATLPSTDGWTVVNRRLRNERKAHSFDLIPSY
jgi:hypothetical protein